MRWISGLVVLMLTGPALAGPEDPSVTLNIVHVSRVKSDGNLHLSLHSDVSSLIPATSLTSMPVLRGDQQGLTPPAATPGLLQRTFGIHAAGGPGALGQCRPNEWSGLQTTIPVGVPAQVQGISL